MPHRKVPDPGVAKKDFFQHSASFEDFFPLEHLGKMVQRSVVSMEEFLARECYTGNLGARPPVPRSKAAEQMHGRKLRDYLRSLVAPEGEANPKVYMPRFKDGGRLSMLAFPPARADVSKAPPGDGSVYGAAVAARLKAFAGDRQVHWLNEPGWLNATVVHFAAWPNIKAGSLLNEQFKKNDCQSHHHHYHPSTHIIN